VAMKIQTCSKVKKIFYRPLLSRQSRPEPPTEESRWLEMIKVTRLNDSVMVINVEKIQSLQATPDTVITFTNHDKLMVKEPVEEISQRIVDYQRAIKRNLLDDVHADQCLHPGADFDRTGKIS
jgi:flagellar protein FlbD